MCKMWPHWASRREGGGNTVQSAIWAPIWAAQIPLPKTPRGSDHSELKLFRWHTKIHTHPSTHTQAHTHLQAHLHMYIICMLAGLLLLLSCCECTEASPLFLCPVAAVAAVSLGIPCMSRYTWLHMCFNNRFVYVDPLNYLSVCPVALLLILSISQFMYFEEEIKKKLKIFSLFYSNF